MRNLGCVRSLKDGLLSQPPLELLFCSIKGGDSLGDISDFSTMVAALERTSKGFSDSTISPRAGIDIPVARKKRKKKLRKRN